MSGTISEGGLYPAEHRSLRELHAMTRALVTHWGQLAERLGEAALQEGVSAGRDLISELGPLAEPHGVHFGPAAGGAGTNIGGLRRVGDKLLERHQALRQGLTDVQVVITALDWLAALASNRSDAKTAAFHTGWAARMRDIETAVRDAILAMAADPDGAIEPADPSVIGRAGAKLGEAIGTAGEAFDARAAKKVSDSNDD